MADITLADIPDTFQVAIVVFATANGTDYHDAGSRVTQALRRATAVLPLPHRIGDVPDAFIDVVDVMDVGMAARNGHLSVRPTDLSWRLRA